MNSSSGKFPWRDMDLETPTKSTVDEWKRKPPLILANPRYPPSF